MAKYIPKARIPRRKRERQPIKAGDTIRLKRSVKHRCPDDRTNNTTAVVQCRLDDRQDAGAIKGGLCTVEDLRGCRYWNEEDVVVIKRAKPP